MMAASNPNLLTQSVCSQTSPCPNFLPSAPPAYGLRRTTSPIFDVGTLTHRRAKVLRLKTTQGHKASAILLPPAASEDFSYGRRQTTSTSTLKIADQLWLLCVGVPCFISAQGRKEEDMGQFLQHPTVVRIAGKPLRPEQKLFTQPIEVFPDLEEATVIRELVPLIKANLSCIGHSDGEISVSAYDTAWVARVPHADGSGRPQFPRTLGWIVANQHPDGSWGDDLKHWLYDRFIQTLACIVALKYWNHSSSCVKRGIEYITRYADKLQDEEILRMPIGFELSFPALLTEAKSLGLDLPYSTPFFRVLEQLREKKLQRVPLELLHSQPTTMLHTLEGIQSLNIDWAKVLKFQSEDGSICCSPSSTAVLYMHTGDKKCLSFLQSAVQKFSHAVPTCYPLDTFHNLWVVDTLERLGISRYFQAEIERVLASVYRQWSDDQGICWARVLKDVPDLDDTSMAFRLLRRHGYNVSAEGFKGFQKDKAFACFAVGQMVQGVSDMYNLFRASQTSYPGEERLEAAEAFSREFLVDALTKNKGNADKWSLKKDLSGEIEYSLKHPDHKSLKRMEVRHYLDKYGPEDAWIGKSIYRLRLVNNSEYLKLAKADFNLCQMLHQKELRQILRWISNSGIADSSNVRERIVMLYAMFAAEVWEPELSAVRIATGKCMFIAMAMYQLFVQQSSVADLRLLVEAVKRWDPSRVHEMPEKFSSCFLVLFNTLNGFANDSTEHNDLIGQLVHIWGRLSSSFLVEAEWRACSTLGALDEYRKIASTTSGLEAITLSSILMSGEITSPHFVTWMEKDSTFLRTASQAVRLAQGIAAKKDHGRLGTVASIYTSYLQENKGATMEQAELHFTSMKKQITKELNLQQGQLSTVPYIVKRVVFSFTKVANFYYDGNYEQESHFELQRLLVSRVE